MTALVELTLGVVARLELVNPPLNLVTRELLEELDAALATLEAATPGDVRAVVVSGRGERAFSAGSNVADFEVQRGPGGRERLALEERVSQRLADLPMPTIAAIEGNALGGGLELALACDLRVASERAKLGLPEVRLAVTPGSGGTQRLPRIVGIARAKALLLTGAVIDAREAERIGLVTLVVPAGQAVAAVRSPCGRPSDSSTRPRTWTSTRASPPSSRRPSASSPPTTCSRAPAPSSPSVTRSTTADDPGPQQGASP